MKSKLKIISFLLLCSFYAGNSFAQKQVNGVWWTPEKNAKIKMYTAQNGKTYGKIVWLEEPIDPETGKEKTDDENPDPELRDRTIMGMVLFKAFEYDGDNKWINGEVYDAESGKTYSCQMTLKSENKLEVRGYIGITLFGRTETFERVVE